MVQPNELFLCAPEIDDTPTLTCNKDTSHELIRFAVR
jgi:hypothetical protein